MSITQHRVAHYAIMQAGLLAMMHMTDVVLAIGTAQYQMKLLLSSVQQARYSMTCVAGFTQCMQPTN